MFHHEEMLPEIDEYFRFTGCKSGEWRMLHTDEKKFIW